MKTHTHCDLSPLIEMQKIIQVHFSNIGLLKLAMTHSSLSICKKYIKNNQRLELLGDSVLGLIVTEHLYNNCETCQEGKMTKMKNYLVSQPVLSAIARNLHLGDFLMMSHSEEVSGGRDKDSTLADAFEALVATIYLDKNLDVARKFVVPLILVELDKFFSDSSFVTDYKSELQYLVQKELKICPEYVVVHESGPHHEKVFSVNLLVNGQVYASGEAKTKKQAEQNAAEQVYKKILDGTIHLSSHS